MSNYDTDRENGHDGGTELDERTERAVEQYLTVTPRIGRTDAEDGLVLVTSESGAEYEVEAIGGRCSCPDMKYRGDQLGDRGCKHVIRARIALGIIEVPRLAVDDPEVDVDPTIGEFVDDIDAREVGGPTSQPVATDGGEIIVAGDEGEVIEDGPTWEGPFTEYDHRGRSTGARFVRCADCGVEVLSGREEYASHLPSCPHSEVSD